MPWDLFLCIFITCKEFMPKHEKSVLSHTSFQTFFKGRQFVYQLCLVAVEAVDQLMNKVICNLNSKIKVAGLFLDLSSACDIVDILHEILFA